MIAALGVNRPEDAYIRCKTYQAVVVTRSKVEVRNVPVARRGWINRKMCDSIELFIRTNGTKGTPIGQCTPRCKLTGYDCHRKSPCMDLPHCSRTLFSPARLSSLLDGIDAERQGSPAAGSGSDAGADAGSSRLQAVVRQGSRLMCACP